jgi:hypothetical protein
LLCYLPVYSSGAKENVPVLTEILEDFGILKFIKNGKVRIITDAAASNIAKLIGCSAPGICASHSLSCAIKRAIVKYSTGTTKAKWDVITDFAARAGKTLPLRELPFPHASNSINNYTINQEVDEYHRERFIRSQIKSTWNNVDFNDADIAELVEGHQSAQFGKALERNLASSIRFRKYCSCVRGILLNQGIYEGLYSGNHPHGFLVENTRQPDYEFLQEISPVLDRFEKAINLFESTTYQHGSAYYAESERLLLFIGKLKKKCPIYWSCSAQELKFYFS